MKEGPCAKRRKRRRRRRHLLLRLQRSKCFYCWNSLIHDWPGGNPAPRAPTIDHVWPRALGGGRFGNSLLACHLCNSKKGDAKPTGCQLIALAWVNAMVERAGFGGI